MDQIFLSLVPVDFTNDVSQSCLNGINEGVVVWISGTVAFRTFHNDGLHRLLYRGTGMIVEALEEDTGEY